MGYQNIHSQANYATPEEIINQGINLKIQTEVISIDAKKKMVFYRGENDKIPRYLYYDRLIMATGSYPNLPPTGGKLNETLFLLKERKDAESIENFISEAHQAVVVGAGLVGVEIARILAQRDINVTLIQSNHRILDKYLDEGSALEVEKQLEKEGVTLLLGTRVDSYHTIDKKIWSRPRIDVFTSNGKIISADGVFMSVGFRPNSFLLAGQVETGDRGAIIVDKYMYTSDPSILAIGDCSTTYMDLTKENIYNPHASDAFRQGLIAAINCHEKKKEIMFTTGTYKFNMDGFTIANTGITLNQAKKFGYDAEEVHYQNRYLARKGNSGYESTGTYYHKAENISKDYSSIYLIYEKKTLKILGLQVLGTVDISQYVNIISLAIQKGVTVPEVEFTDFFLNMDIKIL
ncbi:FAD-dependent oxidoreductase [Enterococcus termitis]